MMGPVQPPVGKPAGPTGAPDDGGSDSDNGVKVVDGKTSIPKGTGVGPKRTSLGDRNPTAVQTDPKLTSSGSQSAVDDLVKKGRIKVGDGEIEFTRVASPDGPSEHDTRLSALHDDEKTGALEKDGSESKGLIGGLKKAIQFLMTSRELQVGVGIAGILACTIAGCFFPVALIGVGPFIIIFANGFIDNPMITGPEGQQPSQTNPQHTQNTDPNNLNTPAHKKKKVGEEGENPAEQLPAVTVTPVPKGVSQETEADEADRTKAFKIRDELRRQGMQAEVLPASVSADELQAAAQRLVTRAPDGVDLSGAQYRDLQGFDLHQFLEDKIPETTANRNALIAEVVHKVRSFGFEYSFDDIGGDQGSKGLLSVGAQTDIPPSRAEQKIIKGAIQRGLADYFVDNPREDIGSMQIRRQVYRRITRELGFKNGRVEGGLARNVFKGSEAGDVTARWVNQKLRTMETAQRQRVNARTSRY